VEEDVANPSAVSSKAASSRRPATDAPKAIAIRLLGTFPPGQFEPETTVPMPSMANAASSIEAVIQSS
jgi:hypothetical protein